MLRHGPRALNETNCNSLLARLSSKPEGSKVFGEVLSWTGDIPSYGNMKASISGKQLRLLKLLCEPDAQKIKIDYWVAIIYGNLQQTEDGVEPDVEPLDAKVEDCRRSHQRDFRQLARDMEETLRKDGWAWSPFLIFFDRGEQPRLTLDPICVQPAPGFKEELQDWALPFAEPHEKPAARQAVYEPRYDDDENFSDK